MTTHENNAVTTHEHSPEGTTEPLTVAEVSASFGVSVSTVRRLLAEGKLPGATKRKGPKGDEWVIPQADIVAQGYRFSGAKSRPAPHRELAPTAESLRAEYEQKLAELQTALEASQADAERQLADLRADRDQRLAQLSDSHAIVLDAELRRLAAEVEKLTERADYERQLLESAETQAHLAATLAMQVREDLQLSRRRVAELEGSTGKRRWLRKTKPAETPPLSET